MNETIHIGVAVIGGGVVGSSVCYWLSRDGIDSMVIEKGLSASGASGSCDGFIFLQSKKDKDLIGLTRHSLGLLKDIRKDLPVDIELEECGGMVLFKDRQSLDDFLSDCPVADSLEVLDRSGLNKLEPEVSSEAAFATMNPGEAQINPIKLNLGLMKAAEENGARLLKKTKVVAFEKKNKMISRVITDSGTDIIPETVVIAAGAWTGLLGKALGLDIPVRPRKGMIAVTEGLPEVIKHVMLDNDYLCCKFKGDKETGFSIEQTLNGNILIGSTRQFCGFDNSSEIKDLATPLRNAARILPFLSDVNIIRTFSGLRPYSGTGLPIIGPSEKYENLYIASGHEGDGIALSAVTGLIISDMIKAKKTGGRTLKDFKGIDIKKLYPRGF